MGIAAVKIKVMPEAPNSDLKAIEKKAEEIILKLGGKQLKITEEPIAFGLNAIILLFAWQEEKSTDELQKQLQSVPDVNSAEIIDFRRAFG
jgi:translation elongation factor aEF-1 beta